LGRNLCRFKPNRIIHRNADLHNCRTQPNNNNKGGVSPRKSAVKASALLIWEGSSKEPEVPINISVVILDGLARWPVGRKGRGIKVVSAPRWDPQERCRKNVLKRIETFLQRDRRGASYRGGESLVGKKKRRLGSCRAPYLRDGEGRNQGSLAKNMTCAELGGGKNA